MKINFDGSYRDVLRVVNAGAKPEEKKQGDFGALLGSLTPEGAQRLEKEEKIRTSESKIKFGQDDPMARFNFSEPKLEAPELEKIGGDKRDSTIVNEGTQSVKTPTIVDVKRKPAQTSGISREKVNEIQAMVDAAGRRFGVDPALGIAVVHTESSFNSNAISSDGHYSKGLFQLLDSTGKDLHQKLEVNGRYDPFNAGMNIDLGINYLRRLHEIFSQNTSLPNNLTTVAAANSSSLEKLAVAAFNAGEGRVASAQARASRAGADPSVYEQIEAYLPDSTKEYVQRVLQYREQYGMRYVG